MCPRVNDTAFTPPRGFRYGTYSQQTNRHHPHLYKPGTTPCGAFPVFPARPPRRRARMAPFSAARPGAAGRPAGAPPVPMGIRRLAPGPVVMASPPIPPHAEGPRPRSSNPDPPGPAIGTRSSGYERIRGGKGGGRGRNGWTPERIRTGEYE